MLDSYTRSTAEAAEVATKGKKKKKMKIIVIDVTGFQVISNV